MVFDIDEAILEYFEEHDWDMTSESVEQCAETLQKQFKSTEDAQEYVEAYIQSIYG